MEDSSSLRVPPNPWESSANDLLKARWSGRVGWSMVAAVAVHVVLFVASPQYQRQAPLRETDSEPVQLEWITLPDPGSTDRALSPEGLPVLEDPDSIPLEQDRPGTMEGSGQRFASIDEVFQERLLSAAAPRPTISEPEPSQRETVSSEEGEGGGSEGFEGTASAAELPDWLGASPMDLDRLATVRPELAVVTPSAWVLIRNPREVEAFMRRTYRVGELERGANGSVSVALWIDGRGRVEWAEISQSSGRSEMDDVALELFSEVALFRPAREDGAPTPRSVVFSVQFPWLN